MAAPIALAGSLRSGDSRARRRLEVVGDKLVLRHQRRMQVACVPSGISGAVANVAVLQISTNLVYRSGAVVAAVAALALAWYGSMALVRRPCTVLSPAGVRVRGDIFDAELGWDELVAVRVEESPAGLRVVGVPGASSYSWRRVRGVVPLYGRPGEGSIFLYDFTYDRPGVVAEVMETLARLAPERRAEYLLGPAVALLRGDHETSQQS
ncbi:hypothetical protein [Nocardioides limicola]|uniref:hypothetical protein n=1 Tax=Nocardioides limicola TaxID=2803368 RepID=UPI00193BC970|nr:hypothetical protein [Nocardioides sp. DJM-14]